MTFTDKELRQIIILSKDMEDFMMVFARNIPGLSLSAFKVDMLNIALKCEEALHNRATAPKEGPQK